MDTGMELNILAPFMKLHSMPLHPCRYSASGRYQLFGTVDGVVRVQPTASPLGLPEGKYWQAPLHDMQVRSGRVARGCAGPLHAGYAFACQCFCWLYHADSLATLLIFIIAGGPRGGCCAVV